MIMKAWKSRTIKIAVALLAVLAAIQFVTYFWYAESIMPRTGIRDLYDYGLLRTKNYVIVEPETWDALDEAQRTVLAEELKTYVEVIYHSVEEVPESAIAFWPITERDKHKQDYERYKRENLVSPRTLAKMRREIESGRRIVGFKKGIRIGWKLEDRGLFWMTCASHHWVSVRGAEWRTDVYVWVLGRWLRVRNLWFIVS